MLTKIRLSLRRIVLDIFERIAKGGVATSHDSLHQAGRHTISRRGFRRIEHAQSPRRPGSHVKQASTNLNASRNPVDSSSDARQLLSDRIGDFLIGTVDDAKHLQCRKLVNVAAFRIPRFCGQVVKLVHGCLMLACDGKRECAKTTRRSRNFGGLHHARWNLFPWCRTANQRSTGCSLFPP